MTISDYQTKGNGGDLYKPPPVLKFWLLIISSAVQTVL